MRVTIPKADALESAVMGPLSGRILHHFSLKGCYIAFFTIFELGSALCGAAQSSAGISNSALTAMAATVPLEQRPGMFPSPMSRSLSPSRLYIREE
jgi:MFS family permease